MSSSLEPAAGPSRPLWHSARANIIFSLLLLLALALAWELRPVLEIVYVSALFAVVLSPVVDRVTRLHVGRWSPQRGVAVVLLVAGVFLLLALFLLVGLPPVIRDIQHFAADLPDRVPQIVARIRNLPLADKLGVDSLAARARGLLGRSVHYLLATLPNWLHRLLDVFTAFVLCVYFLLQGRLAYDYFLSFVPAEQRARLDATLHRAEERMSRWLLGQGALMLILGITSTIVFAALHVRYYFLLGVLMGLFNIVPVIGGLLTISLVALVAALDSWSKMAFVLLFYLVYVQLENAFLTPRIMQSRVNLMPVAVLIALLCGTRLAGIAGALVAVPTAALLGVLADEYLVQKNMPSSPDPLGLG